MTTVDSFQTDVLIVGAGPVGLFAVFECGMLGMRTHVVDVLEMPGGQCAALYPEKPIYDIPAHPSLTGQELVDHLLTQACPFDPVYHLGHQVIGLKRDDALQSFRVTTSQGLEILCKAVILAAGAGAFGPKKPPLEGLDLYEGKSVFYYVQKRDAFRGKHLVIAGGGDSAVDWAISLSDVAASVHLVHRRDKFRCAPDSEAHLRKLAQSGRVELVVPYQLAGLKGEGDQGLLEAVLVETLDGEQRALTADVLLPFYGLSTHLGPLAEWGLALNRSTITIDPTTGETSEPGIFAAGDVAHYPHKRKLILTGFAEVTQAAHKAYTYVFPGQALHFEHSTTSGVKKIGETAAT